MRHLFTRLLSALVLFAHAALFAFGLPSGVLPADPERAVVGAVTQEQWRAHVLAHLRQDGGHYLSTGVSRLPIPPDQPRVTALARYSYDSRDESARALSATPIFHATASDALIPPISLVDLPQVVDLSPDLGLTYPPPRLAALSLPAARPLRRSRAPTGGAGRCCRRIAPQTVLTSLNRIIRETQT